MSGKGKEGILTIEGTILGEKNRIGEREAGALEMMNERIIDIGATSKQNHIEADHLFEIEDRIGIMVDIGDRNQRRGLRFQKFEEKPSSEI